MIINSENFGRRLIFLIGLFCYKKKQRKGAFSVPWRSPWPSARGFWTIYVYIVFFSGDFSNICASIDRNEANKKKDSRSFSNSLFVMFRLTIGIWNKSVCTIIQKYIKKDFFSKLRLYIGLSKRSSRKRHNEYERVVVDSCTKNMLLAI